MLSCAMCPVLVEESTRTPSFPCRMIAATEAKLQVPACFGDAFDLHPEDATSTKTVVDVEDPMLSCTMCLSAENAGLQHARCAADA